MSDNFSLHLLIFEYQLYYSQLYHGWWSRRIVLSIQKTNDTTNRKHITAWVAGVIWKQSSKLCHYHHWYQPWVGPSAKIKCRTDSKKQRAERFESKGRVGGGTGEWVVPDIVPIDACWS